MIGRLRSGLALAAIVAITGPVVAYQAVAIRTGWMDWQWLPPIWHRTVTRLLGIRIEVRGKLAPQRPLMLASNHISWTDIMVVGALGRVTFIAKADMVRWPVFGQMAKAQRTIFVDRERKRKSGEQAAEIGRRLAGGNEAMVLFAEGTTSDGNFLQPFKSSLFGAADIALTEGGAETVYIQPVSITYTRVQGLPMGRQHRRIAAWIGDQDLVPHLLEVLGEGAIDVVVQFGEPVPYTAQSRRKLVAAEVEGRVRTMMGEALRRP